MNDKADFLAYPEISRSLTADFRDLPPAAASTSRTEHKVRSVTAKLKALPKSLFNRLSYTPLELEPSGHVR
jgi:hypothetical protein